MDKEFLKETVIRLTMPPKGILAIDESFPTCKARFEALGVEDSEEARRQYRELLITAPDIENYISGYILFDETIRQSTLGGTSFPSILKEKGIEVGIKVDTGTEDLPARPIEKITKGLEGLRERLREYKALGATFAKWRALYLISAETPSALALKENAVRFAKYAKICQEENIVPIVEPEILIDGNHSIEKCYEITSHNLRVVFDELRAKDIYMPGMILKTSMVLPGKDLELQVYTSDIARLTIKCLKENVPIDIGGIVFLSGGQNDKEATIRLDAMHKLGPLPWPLTFSYGRAIQNPALQAWAKNPRAVAHAQTLLLDRARNNSLASIGQYEEK